MNTTYNSSHLKRELNQLKQLRFHLFRSSYLCIPHVDLRATKGFKQLTHILSLRYRNEYQKNLPAFHLVVLFGPHVFFSSFVKRLIFFSLRYKNVLDKETRKNTKYKVVKNTNDLNSSESICFDLATFVLLMLI